MLKIIEFARYIVEAHSFAVYAVSWISGLALILIGMNKKWPPFKIEYVEGWGPFREVTDEATENGTMREWTYRIKITARWPVCKVSALMSNLTPQPNARYARPIALQFSNDSSSSLLRIMDKDRSEFVDILRCRKMGDSSEFYLLVDHCIGGDREIPLQEYCFDLEISGDGVDSLYRHFVIWLGADGLPNLSINNLIYKIKRRIRSLYAVRVRVISSSIDHT
jgi:hypothetical protein